MKIKSILFTLLLLITSVLIAQNYVSTEPQDKNAILEEFTGVSCPNCPAGHVVMAGILAANPYRAFCIAYHPSNSSYTAPYPGDPDFRRTYPNVFYTTPYCGSGRFMPSSFINRRIYGGDRLQSRAQWASYADGIMAEPSPANMGLSTTFDFMTQMLNITVEIYYTDNMTDDNTVYVLLAENDLVSQQSGGSSSYTHKHTFREAFVGQWGDLITEPTTQGSLVTLEYSWDATGSGYIMSNCEVLAFIENQSSGEVITGVGVHVGESTYIEPTADFSASETMIFLGGSIDFSDLSTNSPTEWSWTFEGGVPENSSSQNPTGITYDVMGTYDVTLIASNEYGVDTLTREDYIYVENVGIDEQMEQAFSLYPNPCNGKLFVKPLASEKIEEIILRSVNGQIAKTFSSTGTVLQTLDLEDLTTGIYLIEIRTKNDVHVAKVVRK